MLRYWYSFTPLVFVFALTPLALPWLGLIALMLFAFVALGAVGALAWGIVFVPYAVVRTGVRHRHSRMGTKRQPATVSATRPRVATQSLPAGAVVLLGNPPSESERLP